MAVGAAGFLSALVTMFINTSQEISVKWMLLAIWLFSTVAIILLKLVFDLVNEKRPPAPYEVPIKYLSDDQILLIRRNENFGNQIVVGCYSNVDDIERLIFLGAVHHIQERFIQIRILPTSSSNEAPINPNIDLKTILVRPVVPFSAIQAQLI